MACFQMSLSFSREEGNIIPICYGPKVPLYFWEILISVYPYISLHPLLKVPLFWETPYSLPLNPKPGRGVP